MKKNEVEMEEKSFRELRRERGISLAHVARFLKRSEQTIRNKEKGKCDFTAPEARALCHLYNVDFREVRL